MSDVIGDVSELKRNTITATAVYTFVGNSGAFHFRLSTAEGINKYFESHAKVKIVGQVFVRLSTDVSNTVAGSAAVAIVPDKYRDWPTTEEQVIQLQGATRASHTLLVDPTDYPIEFGNETAVVLKPKTLIDYPPVVVGYIKVNGGTVTSRTHVLVKVPLLVEGVAHHKTW